MTAEDFELFIVTAEAVEKVRPVARKLQESGDNGLAVTVLTGAHDKGDCSWVNGSLRVCHFPGESVFDLRSRIPTLAGDSEWIVILEDHNLVDASWLKNIRVALGRCDAETLVVVGAATNERSTDEWSWANFLCVLGFHWAPEIHSPLEPLGFNVALRRELLGTDRLALGEYESEVVPRAMLSAQADASFPVDHMQFRKFPEVVYYHWCNGRVTGAGMREFSPDKMNHVYAHARETSFARQRRLRRVLRSHPLRSNLPWGSTWRTQLLAVAHSLGALYGGYFGVGRAPWALE